METVKEKKSFKESVKATGGKVKAYAKKQADKVKRYGKNYKSDLQKAYEIGYGKGWEDSYDIPNRLGAKTAAMVGYKKGVKNRRKSDKYVAQYKNKGAGTQ